MRYSKTSLAGVPSTFWAGGVHDTSRTPLSPPIVAQPPSTAMGTSGVTHRSRTRLFIATILPESELGAEGGTRTPTGCPTRPSNVRVCQFRHFGAVRARSITLSRTTDNSPNALAEPRIERVADPLTQQVVREHRDEDRDSRIGREPPANLDGVLALVQDVAPGRVRRLHAEPEERQSRLGEDRGGNAERHRHEHRADGVGQDVAPDRAGRARADRLGPQDELALLQRKKLGADETGDAHPAGEPDHRHDRPDRGPQESEHREEQEKAREDKHQVDGP